MQLSPSPPRSSRSGRARGAYAHASFRSLLSSCSGCARKCVASSTLSSSCRRQGRAGAPPPAIRLQTASLAFAGRSTRLAETDATSPALSLPKESVWAVQRRMFPCPSSSSLDQILSLVSLELAWLAIDRKVCGALWSLALSDDSAVSW